MFRRHFRTYRRFHFQTPKLGMGSKLSGPPLAIASKSGNILGPSTLLFTGTVMAPQYLVASVEHSRPWQRVARNRPFERAWTGFIWADE